MAKKLKKEDFTPEETAKVVKALGSLIQTLSNTGADLPLQGNLLPTREYIEAIQNDDAMIFRMYGAERQYFSNYFKILGEENIELYFHRIMGSAFDYGTVAVRLNDGILELYGCNNLNVDHIGNVITAQIWEYVMIGQPITYTKSSKYKNGDIITNEEFAFLRGGQLGGTAWGMLIPFLEQRSRIGRIIKKNIPATQLKGHYMMESGDPEAIMEELKWINDVDVNVILTITSQLKKAITTKNSDGKLIMSDNSGLRVEPIILPEQPNAKSYADGEIINSIQNYFTGHVVNISTKQERNVSGEVSFNLGHFEVMMAEYKNEIKIFLKQYQKIFNTNDLEVELQSDLRPLIEKDTQGEL